MKLGSERSLGWKECLALRLWRVALVRQRHVVVLQGELDGLAEELGQVLELEESKELESMVLLSLLY